MPIDTRPLDFVFDQLLKPFKERKHFPEGMGGGRYFYGNSGGVGGLTFPCENGKSEGVGGSYLKFPPW